MEEIKDIPTIHVPNDLFKSNEFQIDPNMFAEPALPDPSLGYTEELNESKNKITPLAQKWEKTIKFYISDYELIDIFRNPRYAHQRYNEPIIKYRNKWDKDESKGVYPVFSRAFFKLWEVLGSSNVLDQFKGKELTVANVAEGPGGFIHCLIDFRKKQNGPDWNKDAYHGITLKIGKENEGHALDWDWQRAKEYFTYVREKGHKVELSYGGDGSGNMLKLENLEYYMKVVLGGKKCQLVTGDGGLDLSSDEEYSKQELANGTLFFAEILYAFHVQEEKGVFILKIYDIYYNVTLQLILLLSLHYEKVNIIKPHTSRPASSEKYLVCEGFKGVSEEKKELMRKLLEQWVGDVVIFDFAKQKFACSILNFDLEQTRLDEFKKQLAEFNKRLSQSQIDKINRGLDLAHGSDLTSDQILEIKQNQKDLAKAWCELYNMPYQENLVLYKDTRRSSKSRSRDRQRNKMQFDPKDRGDEEKLKERAKRFGADMTQVKDDDNYTSRRDSRQRRSRSRDRDRRYDNRDNRDNRHWNDRRRDGGDRHGNRYDNRRDSYGGNRYRDRDRRDYERSKSRSKDRNISKEDEEKMNARKERFEKNQK